MFVSGSTLPVPSGFFEQSPNPQLADQRQAGVERYQDTGRQSRQQTVEYVFRGEFDDELLFDEQNRYANAQLIDPANREAISAYVDTDTVSLQRPERQGRLLDVFI